MYTVSGKTLGSQVPFTMGDKLSIIFLLVGFGQKSLAKCASSVPQRPCLKENMENYKMAGDRAHHHWIKCVPPFSLLPKALPFCRKMTPFGFSLCCTRIRIVIKLHVYTCDELPPKHSKKILIFKKSKLCSSQSNDSCSAVTVLVSMSTGKEPCGIAMVSHTQPSCTQTPSAQDAAVLALSLRGGMLKRAQRQTKAKCCHTNIGLRLPPYKTQDSTKWLV